MESRKMVLMNLFAGQQGKHRHREQKFRFLIEKLLRIGQVPLPILHSSKMKISILANYDATTVDKNFCHVIIHF